MQDLSVFTDYPYYNNLLNSSSANDVKVSGGEVRITGLQPIRLQDLISAKRRRYRAEVVQIVNIGKTNKPTIVANTVYELAIGNTNKTESGKANPDPKRYKAISPATLSGSAVTDRKNVYDDLVNKINNDLTADVTAATTADGGDWYLKITDKTGYYPARPKNRRGVSLVLATRGFVDSQHVEVATAGIYSFGDGTRMVDDVPVYDKRHGNLSSGEIQGFSNPVSGQFYDGFDIVALRSVADFIPSPIGQVYQMVHQRIMVDNGTGADTSNLAGFNAFRDEFERLIYYQFEQDPSAIIEYFGSLPTFAGSTTPAPTGTAGDINVVNTGKNSLHYSMIGTQTILNPVWDTDGLDIVLDQDDNEGIELSVPIGNGSKKGRFTVGKEECSIKLRTKIGDVSDTDDYAIGFRKEEGFQAAVDDYDEMAALNVISGDIKIETILNGGATTTTDTTLNFADGEIHDLEVRVAKDGSVSFIVDGVDKTSVQASAFKFDAGEKIVPFIYEINAGANDPGTHLQRLFVIPASVE